MIAVNVKALRGAMKAMTAVVEARTTVPICQMVLVSSSPGAMSMTSTDLEMEIRQQVDLEDPGSNKAMAFCVDARTLEKIAAKLPADGVAMLEADGNTGISVKCGRSRFKLPTLDVADFPIMPTPDWDAEFEMPSGDLTALIDSVRFAISTEETRYYLNGIFVHVPRDSDGEGERMFGAATDGSRLARFDCAPADGSAQMPDIILPRKMVGILDQLLDDHAGPVGVAVDKGKIRFEIGKSLITSKLIDGTFPDYTRVIPTANDKAIWFKPRDLAEAVERVIVISSAKQRLVKFTAGGDLIRLDVVSPENGTATEEVPCDYAGPEIVIGFNGAFMLDVLKHLTTGGDDGRAQVVLADPAAPSLWRESDDARRLYVLMPMRVA
jgi:DNA polymerase-3 subunit beta